MFEQILEGLKTKYPGVGAKTLERIAKKMAKTVTKEEDVKTAVDGVTFQQLIDNEGDFRATQATETSIANYEQKFGLKNGKPVEKPQDPPIQKEKKPDEPQVPQDETQKMLKQLLDNQKALTDELAAIKTEKIGNSRKGRLTEMLKEADDKTRNRYLRDFDRLTFKDEDDFNGWLDERKPEIDEDIKSVKAAGASASAPKGGATHRKQGEVDPAVKEYLDKGKTMQATQPFSTMIGGPQPQVQPKQPV
jgi:hypothetical protein